MDRLARKKIVLAMELLARCINDEYVFEGWLMSGVADGEIPEGSLDPNDVDECYIEDEKFRHLLSCFLRRMSAAYKSGGLYVDNVVSDTKE